MKSTQHSIPGKNQAHMNIELFNKLLCHFFADELISDRPQDLSRFREDTFTSPVTNDNIALSRPQIIVSPRKIEHNETNTQEQVNIIVTKYYKKVDLNEFLAVKFIFTSNLFLDFNQ